MQRVLTLILMVFLSGCVLAPKQVDTLPSGMTTEQRKILNVFNDAGHHKLLVFQKRICGQCIRFNNDILPEFYRSEYSKNVHLVRMDVTQKNTLFFMEHNYLTGRMNFVSQTPTFMLWEGTLEDGQELYRFTGYLSREQFYAQLDIAMDFFVKGHKKGGTVTLDNDDD